MNTDTPQRNASDQDLLLERIRSSERAMAEISRLELGGNGLLTMLSAHMHEVAEVMPGEFKDISEAATKYFFQFYDQDVQEFHQQDDLAFSTHHCLRIMFEHWQEEMDQLNMGALGSALSDVGLRFPELTPPTPPGSRGIATYWYDQFRKELDSGSLPQLEAARNPIMPVEQRRSWDRQAVGAWWGVLTGIIGVWGEEIPLMWSLLSHTIAIRREANELGAEAVGTRIAANRGAYQAVLDAYRVAHERWHGIHASTLSVHFPMFRKFLVGAEDWFLQHDDFESMGIIEPLKYEIYMEVASTVAQLRGEPLEMRLPESQYWRRNPWTPPPLAVGAPGMPPF